jgi:hypothetical protein
MGNASKIYPIVYLTVPEAIAAVLGANGLHYQSQGGFKTLKVQYIANINGEHIMKPDNRKRTWGSRGLSLAILMCSLAVQAQCLQRLLSAGISCLQICLVMNVLLRGVQSFCLLLFALFDIPSLS